MQHTSNVHVCSKWMMTINGGGGSLSRELIFTLTHMSRFAVFCLATYQPYPRHPAQLQEQTAGTVALHRTRSRSLQKLQTGRPHEEDQSSAAVGHLSLSFFI